MGSKRVLVVGAGAAGMSCADGLARHPDKFDVTLIGTSSPPLLFSLPLSHTRSIVSRSEVLADARSIPDAQAYCGGQAFSIPINEARHGSPWMNQGVQGGSYIYQ